MSSVALDTSCWIRRLEDPASKDQLSAAVGSDIDSVEIVVPSTVIFEFRRWGLRNGFEDVELMQMAEVLESNVVVALSASLATRAANTSVATGLGFADAVILATARSRFAPLLTYDRDFTRLPGAIVLER